MFTVHGSVYIVNVYNIDVYSIDVYNIDVYSIDVFIVNVYSINVYSGPVLPSIVGPCLLLLLSLFRQMLKSLLQNFMKCQKCVRSIVVGSKLNPS